ncbi:hypothetical protein [Marinifilum flexuosum]|uniref:hypothetical protein n=1 Tax=Marinifilum flexuosum TaxID=1117708 RepID=UPI002495A37A|nr:hypothetical protein [Marinifilum flexuosum]
MIWLQSTLFFINLMLLHEAGHVLSAKIMGIPVQEIGFTMKPYPHLYVSIDWPHKKKQKYFYLFAGMMITLSVFIISYFNDFWGIQALLYALIFQVIIETNPFHSDVVIAIITNKKAFKEANFSSFKSVYKKELDDFHYSSYWYLHFMIWLVLIVLLLRLN